RGAAGIGYRTGRQAIDDVSVVGRRLGDIASGERTTQRALAEYETVNDGRIGLQLHLLLQAVDEHRRYAGALLGLARLLLDDRSKHNELIRRFERQIGIAAFP